VRLRDSQNTTGLKKERRTVSADPVSDGNRFANTVPTQAFFQMLEIYLSI
jgi:hypothetical protein